MTINSYLDGSTLKPKLRYGDLQNRISLGTAGVFLSKDRFKVSNPYSKEYDQDGNLTIYLNLHFLKEMRRQLSGEWTEGTSTFSSAEKTFFEDYQEYQLGVSKLGDTLFAVNALDDWLLEEIMGTTHNTLDRTYTVDHKWRNTEKRDGTEEGILWI